MKKERNQLLNIAEAIAALLVIFIHFPLPGIMGGIITALARVSVPLFFCISGYFLYRGDAVVERRIIPRKIKRLLRLILFSESIYFIFYVALQVQNIGFSIQAVVKVIDAEILDRYLPKAPVFISVFAPPFNGTGWFMGSLAIVYIVFSWILLCNWQHHALPYAICGIALGVILNRILLYLVGYSEIPYERTLLFIPLPFFIVGYHLRKNEKFLTSISDRKYYLLLCIGIIITTVEQFFGTFTLYIGTLILVPTILSFCGKHKDFLCEGRMANVLSHIGESTATYIYIIHMLVGSVVNVVFQQLFPDAQNAPVYSWGLPAVICFAYITAAEIVYAIRNSFVAKRR